MLKKKPNLELTLKRASGSLELVQSSYRPVEWEGEMKLRDS